MKTRVIFHVDMDAFFASIEILLNPKLKGKPVIVGGQPDRRGVVSTCSYEARVFGVHSAMSLTEARRRCPHAIFLDGHYSLYRDYSHRIMDIFRQLTEKVEVVSVDEAYMDLTDIVERYESPYALAQLVKKAVFQKTQLPCSIGIASNKLIAKVASGKAKPNGVFEVPFGSEASFLAHLLIQSLPGIGEKTQERFNREGIIYVSDLQVLSLDELMQSYGSWGYYFYKAAHGLDQRPVEWIDQPPKSIGAETTFETDQNDRTVLIKALLEQTEQAWRRLRKHKMRTGSICLKLRTGSFHTVTHARQLLGDTNDLEKIKQEIVNLFDDYYSGDPPLRLVGVSLRKLTDHYWQPTLWENRNGIRQDIRK